MRPAFPLATATLAVAAALVLLPSVAHAYVDPAAGSLVLQMVLAGALGAAFTLKTYWRRLVAFVRARVGRAAS